MSGNPTYQDLTTWFVDHFRFADNPDGITMYGLCGRIGHAEVQE